MEDLDQLEGRIEELEGYLGIGHVGGDLNYFVKNDIEKLDAKCIRLDDFMKVIDDKNFLMNDLHPKFEQLESFLKTGNKFTTQCIDLSKRSAMVAENEEYLRQFFLKLKELQTLEHYLSF